MHAQSWLSKWLFIELSVSPAQRAWDSKSRDWAAASVPSGVVRCRKDRVIIFSYCKVTSSDHSYADGGVKKFWLVWSQMVNPLLRENQN